jgi:hypothetical protein
MREALPPISVPAAAPNRISHDGFDTFNLRDQRMPAARSVTQTGNRAT